MCWEGRTAWGIVLRALLLVTLGTSQGMRPDCWSDLISGVIFYKYLGVYRVALQEWWSHFRGPEYKEFTVRPLPPTPPPQPWLCVENNEPGQDSCVLIYP